MSTRPNLPPQVVMNGLSMATNQNSAITILANQYSASYGVSWSGSSPLGALSVQGSNDYALNSNGTVKNAGTWTTFTLSVNGSPANSVTVSGNSGTVMIDIVATSVYAIQLVYAATSGTGAITATVTGKVS